MSENGRPPPPDVATGPLNDAFKFFVAHMPFDVTPDHVRQHFSQFGPVNFVKIIYDKGTGKSRGYGFLYMQTAEGNAAVESYARDNKNRIQLMGRSNVFLARHDEKRVLPMRNPPRPANSSRQLQQQQGYGQAPTSHQPSFTTQQGGTHYGPASQQQTAPAGYPPPQPSANGYSVATTGPPRSTVFAPQQPAAPPQPTAYVPQQSATQQVAYAPQPTGQAAVDYAAPVGYASNAGTAVSYAAPVAATTVPYANQQSVPPYAAPIATIGLKYGTALQPTQQPPQVAPPGPPQQQSSGAAYTYPATSSQPSHVQQQQQPAPTYPQGSYSPQQVQPTHTVAPQQPIPPPPPPPRYNSQTTPRAPVPSSPGRRPPTRHGCTTRGDPRSRKPTGDPRNHRGRGRGDRNARRSRPY